MGSIASQITSLTIVYAAVYSGSDLRKHQSSASLAFVWGIHRDRWIPRTKGQLRGKCFHLMTSSWLIISSHQFVSRVTIHQLINMHKAYNHRTSEFNFNQCLIFSLVFCTTQLLAANMDIGVFVCAMTQGPTFIKEVNPQLTRRPLKTNGRLANHRLTSLVKESTVHPHPYACRNNFNGPLSCRDLFHEKLTRPLKWT